MTKPQGRPAAEMAAERAERGRGLRKVSLQKRWAAYPLIEVGGGPWRVLDECPAPRHNTGVAGLGRLSGGSGRQTLTTKCICPRALELVNGYREKERGRRAGTLPPGRPRSVSGNGSKSGKYLPGYVSNSLGGPAPTLDGQGLCRTPNGRDIADKVIGAAEPRGHWLKQHRVMCEACPVRLLCLDWAQRNEEPAGSWDGMYGGLTQRERSEKR